VAKTGFPIPVVPSCFLLLSFLYHFSLDFACPFMDQILAIDGQDGRRIEDIRYIMAQLFIFVGYFFL